MRILLAWAAILAGAAGLALDWSAIFPSVMTVSTTNLVARSFPDAFIYFWTYFTHLTNLWLLLTYAAVLSGWNWLGWFRRPVIMASAAAFITLVMLYYHFMLAPTLQLEGALGIATWLLHYVAPILYLVWWALFAPHGVLRFQHIGLMLLPGIGYVAWVLLRGAVVHEYPYDILDAGKFGYGGVAIGVAVLLVAVSIFSVIIVWGDRVLAQRGKPA
ncbi:Pr6Pr family membrane protein [Devosia sp. Root105]|uniref:Pr6Pr family membrane protein n=1 Tax=Devosia sp. Root105 TaxID=1736423 RepID=UPI000AD51144|nr:Pr6Pr family membrane protein [Devosia sp. Root105]